MKDNSTALYDRADWYDRLHRPGTDDEVWLLERVAAAHGRGGKEWLEPACGTGRYLTYLAKRGYRLTGYDINTRALAFASARLKRYGKRCRLIKDSMTRFCEPGRFDVAFNTLSTFRHLLTERDALKHLRLTSRSLRPGGLYLVGLDLADYATVADDEETWQERSIRHVMISLAPDARGRRERMLNFVTRGGKTLESAYDLRSYDRKEWLSLIAKTPFTLAGTYGPSGRRTVLNDATREALFVLRNGPAPPV